MSISRTVNFEMIETYLEMSHDRTVAKVKLALDVGVSEATINRVMAGHVPSAPTRRMIAVIIGATEDEVFPFGGKDSLAA